MPALSTWNLDPTRLLTRRELATILADLVNRCHFAGSTCQDYPSKPLN
jgi:hypothetical protein